MGHVLAQIPSMHGPDTFETILFYDTTDPYAIRATFDSNQWEFSRSLLTEGLVRRAGDGDVTIAANDTIVGIRISSPVGGVADLALPREAVEEFLENTYLFVPYGGEAAFIDIDAELETLLS